MLLTVELVTPTRALLQEEVEVVSVPTPLGEISILPHHLPLITTLAAGELRLRRGAAVQTFAVSGGVLAVREGSPLDAARPSSPPQGAPSLVEGRGVATATRVVILADVAEHPEEISEAAAEEARRRALELSMKVAADDVAFAAASAAVERELARLRIARKFRHRGRHGPSRGTLAES